MYVYIVLYMCTMYNSMYTSPYLIVWVAVYVCIRVCRCRCIKVCSYYLARDYKVHILNTFIYYMQYVHSIYAYIIHIQVFKRTASPSGGPCCRSWARSCARPSPSPASTCVLLLIYCAPCLRYACIWYTLCILCVLYRRYVSCIYSYYFTL